MHNRTNSEFAFLRVLCGGSSATFAVKRFFFRHDDKNCRMMEPKQ